MDIKEARGKKEELTSEITRLISIFERETGAMVDRIGIERACEFGGEHSVFTTLKIEVHL